MIADPSVLLIDDHAVVRMGVKILLEERGKFRVCGEASTVEEARDLTRRLLPDLIVLDLLLGGRDGIELATELLALHSGVRILVYSSLDESEYAHRALRAGVRGFLMKSAGLEEVATALTMLAAGEYYSSEAFKRSLVHSVAKGTASHGNSVLDTLSDRELQVFRLLGSGQGSSGIAGELHLSIKTVGAYRERLKDKLGIQTGRELERKAERYVRHGTID